MLLSSELKELFKRVFVDGLRNYINRPTLNEFRYACLRAKDLLINCTNPDCNASFYYDENGENECPWCGKKHEDIIKLTFIENIDIKEFKIPDVSNGDGYKRLNVAPKNINQLILNEGIQTVNKRHFESITSVQKDEKIFAINVEVNGDVSVKKLKDISIYIYNKENNTVKPLKLGAVEQLIRKKNALMFNKDFNITDEKILNLDEIEKIYGQTSILNYAALY